MTGTTNMTPISMTVEQCPVNAKSIIAALRDGDLDEAKAAEWIDKLARHHGDARAAHAVAQMQGEPVAVPSELRAIFDGLEFDAGAGRISAMTLYTRMRNLCLAYAAPPAPAVEPGELDDTHQAFEAWWLRHGQFCRAGGGDYEKTFAFAAWQASLAIPEKREPLTDAQVRRLWNNSPEIHKDAPSFAAFKRLVDLVQAANPAEKRERLDRDSLIEQMCAAIKAADNKAAESDYMLDSDDCIKVLRGQWDPHGITPADAKEGE